MKFRVERDALEEALSWVARALPNRPVVPLLAGLLLRADDDGVQLSCFDYEVSARATVPAVVGEPGRALVPGRLLAEIAKSLPAADVEVNTAAGLMMVTCGGAEFAFVSLPLDEYPQLPELPAVSGTVDGGLLATAAAQVVPAASRDDTQPMLTGVYLDADGGVLTLAATDRYRMAVRRIDWEPRRRGARFSALVPARTLADIGRTVGPGQPVTIAIGSADAAGTEPADGLISFEGAGRRMTARLIGAEFIRYESRFPASFEASAELPAGPFTEAVRRVSLVADRGAPVQLAFRRDVVVVEAQSDGRARAVESVPVVLAGPDQMISFNPHYLLDGLTAAALTEPGGGDAAGLIRLQFTSPARPALITWLAGEGGSEGAPAYRYLVVPLRAPSGAV
ncbi:MAG: DNA polymerase III subunit beta [Actinobacteria bacterium]|nr:DNA polymerase III subunit beta [Actinomycetota bacterium]